MKVEEALIRLRDDLKEWVTNNLNAIGKPKASDVTITTPEGMEATDVQNAIVELNGNFGGLTFGKDGDGNCGYYGADGSLIPFKKGIDEAEIYHGLTSYTFTKDYKVVYATSHRGNTTVPPFYLNDIAQNYISEVHGNNTASGAYLFHDIKSGDIVKTTGALTVICFR